MTVVPRPGSAGLIGLIGELARDPHRPMLVCHRADGARTELSGASLANWIAKVAGLLRDELALGPGDVATVHATTGWQLAPVLLGCWWAGLGVTATSEPAAAVAFVDPGSDADTDEVFVLSGHPLGAPTTELAGHQRDFTTAVLPQSDRLGAAAPRDDRWTAGWIAGRPVTAAQLMDEAAAAGQAARPAGAGTAAGGDRPVLISTAPWTVPDGTARTLLAALAVGGTLVQCAPGLTADALATIARSEHATAAIGPEIPGFGRPAG